MTALILVFAGDNGTFDVLPFCWLPGETLQDRIDEDHMPYGVWAQQGHLLTFPGRSTDPKAVAMKIAELHGRYHIERSALIDGASRTASASLAPSAAMSSWCLSARASKTNHRPSMFLNA